MTSSPIPETGVPTCYRHPGRESYIRCQRCDRPICPDCMRDAAVGFQCPSCIAEGAKSTRSGRTAYGGLRPSDASITSGVIIAINVGVFLAVTLTGGTASRLVDWLVLRPRGLCESAFAYTDMVAGACAPGTTSLPGVSDGAYWQLITSAFTHEQTLHLAFNMFALWILGPQLEIAIGRARFLGLYLLSALAGSALVYWSTGPFTATLGASGAIFGLMAALLVLSYKVGGNVQSLLVWIGINAAFTLFGSNISWQGHLGGFLGGLVVGGALIYAPRGPRRTLVQVAAMVAVAVVLVGAIAARSVDLGA